MPPRGDGADPPAPQRRALLGAFLPAAVLVVAFFCLPAVIIGRDLGHFMGAAGSWSWGIAGAAVCTAVVVGVLLRLASTRPGIPAFIAIGTAALPWLVGVAGMREGLGSVQRLHLELSEWGRQTLAVTRADEVFDPYVLGAWLTAALLLGVGIALGLSTNGLRAGRDRELRIGAAVACGLALVAATTAASAASVTGALAGLADVQADLVSSLLERGLDRAEPMQLAADLGVWIAAAAVVAVAGLSFVLDRSRAGVVGGALALLVAVLFVGTDAWATRTTAEELAHLSAPLWGDVDGFEPAIFDDGSADIPHGFITPDRVVFWEGDSMELTDTDALAERLDEVLRGEEPRHMVTGAAAPVVIEEIPEWLQPSPSEAGSTPEVPEGQETSDDELYDDEEMAREEARAFLGVLVGYTGPSEPGLILALDRRVTVPALRRVLDAAAAAGARSLTLVGAPGPLDPGLVERARAASPLLATAWSRAAGQSVYLWSEQERDVLLGGRSLYTTVETDPRVEVMGGSQEFTLPTPDGLIPYPEGCIPSERGPLFVAMGEQATLVSVLGALDLAHDDGLSPMLLSGSLDSLEEEYPSAEPETEEPAEAPGTVGATPQLNLGEPTVRGALPNAAAGRVLRRHQNEVRSCFEQGLARDPNLRGTVILILLVGAEGDVQSGNTRASTFSDAQVLECLVTAGRRWRFPSFEGIAVVEYPYSFVAE